MTLNELDAWFNSFLKKEIFPGDPSRNGIQIQNAAPDSKEIKTVAFAVDACEASSIAAAKAGADLLVVHHGLFWGACETLTGVFYKRAAAFLKNDLALIAYHLPLDANNPYGNNYGLAAALGLQKLQSFGYWRGMPIGVSGELAAPVTADQLSASLSKITKTQPRTLAFGKSQIKSVGIISGGASEDVEQAIELGLDCYITGEFAHEQYHLAEECGINVIAGGHYGTETMGVSLLKEKVEKELGLSTLFIDLPTDL
jgi:dinuclear metal center YbgI/SA1388 family protein